MATNPIGPGTRNISVNVPDWLYSALSEKARNMGVSRNKYISAVLQSWVESGNTLQISEHIEAPRKMARVVTVNRYDAGGRVDQTHVAETKTQYGAGGK